VSNKISSYNSKSSSIPSNSKNLGIIGLGRVGIPAVKAYIENGYNVYGYARRPEVIAEFEELGGIHKPSPAIVGEFCPTIIVLVLNDQQVIDVIAGENGILKGIKPDSTIINMSTINRYNLQLVSKQCADRNIGFVDCPFTGGPARVPSGSLTLIAAAPPDLITAVTPILDVIGNVVHVGNEPGLGQAVKHCNQLLVGATHAATMEVITLARKLNLDASLVCKVIGSGIAGSDYFRLLSESVLDNKPSPGGLGQMCKDVSIVSNTVDEVKMSAYIAKAAAKYFKLAEDWGMQNMEGADLIQIIEKVSDQGENS
jgi:3-hydroxyisobutyrate dehydrogenase-like beta-hydroxyacid dehydrogenase